VSLSGSPGLLATLSWIRFCGSRTGSGLRTSASTSENAATHAPSANDNDRIAAAVTNLFL
jgi:hypothetical protein